MSVKALSPRGQGVIVEYDDGSAGTYNRYDLKEVIPDVLVDTNGNMKVSCAFSKWSMGWEQDAAAILVSFNHYPNAGDIYLYDVCEQDIERLIIMFNKIKNSIKNGTLSQEEMDDINH